MKTEVSNFRTGDCGHTGKKDVPVADIEVGNSVQTVSVKSLVDVLRLIDSLPETTAPDVNRLSGLAYSKDESSGESVSHTVHRGRGTSRSSGRSEQQGKKDGDSA